MRRNFGETAEKVAYYRARAEECEAKADRMNNPRVEVLMREVALQWLELATQAQLMYRTTLGEANFRR